MVEKLARLVSWLGDLIFPKPVILGRNEVVRRLCGTDYIDKCKARWGSK